MQFNTQILEGRLAQFNASKDVNQQKVFYDRGLPDVLAYMDYFKQIYPIEFVQTCKNHLYDIVFILPPWEEIYVVDEERFESYEEAVHIHDCLDYTYTSLGYTPITVPKASIASRVAHILDFINP